MQRAAACGPATIRGVSAAAVPRRYPPSGSHFPLREAPPQDEPYRGCRAGASSAASVPGGPPHDPRVLCGGAASRDASRRQAPVARTVPGPAQATPGRSQSVRRPPFADGDPHGPVAQPSLRGGGPPRPSSMAASPRSPPRLVGDRRQAAPRFCQPFRVPLPGTPASPATEQGFQQQGDTAAGTAAGKLQMR